MNRIIRNLKCKRWELSLQGSSFAKDRMNAIKRKSGMDTDEKNKKYENDYPHRMHCFSGDCGLFCVEDGLRQNRG